MKYVIIELPDDFERGCCYDCPFSYYEIDGFDDVDVQCVFNHKYNECSLEIKNNIDRRE